LINIPLAPMLMAYDIALAPPTRICSHSANVVSRRASRALVTSSVSTSALTRSCACMPSRANGASSSVHARGIVAFLVVVVVVVVAHSFVSEKDDIRRRDSIRVSRARLAISRLSRVSRAHRVITTVDRA